jgi:hypothetical protein
MSIARHGIKHVSPSSLNLWIANPHQWCRRYLNREKDSVGPAAWRGTAVEMGLTYLVRYGILGAASEAALYTFDMNVPNGELTPAIEKERELIIPMVERLAKMSWPVDLLATQIKIEHWLEGCDVPCIGYLDFAFSDQDLDLKTTKRLPSEPSAPHVRQVSLYRAARKRPGSLLYVTDKKEAEYPVTDDMMQSALDDMTVAAKSLSRFLSKMENAEEALSCLPVNYDDFRTAAFTAHGTASGFEPMAMEGFA